jgi:hypothetical protein
MKTEPSLQRNLTFIILAACVCLTGIPMVNALEYPGTGNPGYGQMEQFSPCMSDNTSVLLISNYSHEISLQEIESMEDTIIANYREQNNLEKISLFKTRIADDDSSYIQAYGFAIRNGTVYSYTGLLSRDLGFAGRVNDSYSMNKNALNWYYQLPADDPNARIILNPDIPLPSMDQKEKSLKPYGEIHSTLVIMGEGYTDDAHTQYGFIVKEIMNDSPGVNSWETESDCQIETFGTKHDYSISALSDTKVYDYQPAQSESGSRSYSITVSLPKGLSQSWSFSQGDYSRDDKSVVGSKYAKWIWTANSDSAKKDASNTYPGSSGYYTYPSAKGTYTLMGIRDEARFCHKGNCFVWGGKTLNLDYDFAIVYK